MIMKKHDFAVGVNAFVVKDGKLLLGKRKNTYGAEYWGLPGGHLEFGEAMLDAVARELFEETGLEAESYSFLNLVNTPRTGEHYIQLGFIANNVQGEPVLKEPEKCYGWEYFELANLPQEIFTSHKNLIKTFVEKSGNFVDSEN